MASQLEGGFKNSLPINLNTFGFVQREKVSGKPVIYKCGRDFLYYALHYYKPKKYNPNAFSPTTIDNERVFGFLLPWFLMWTTLQFSKLPQLLFEEQLELKINNFSIKNYVSFVLAFIFPKRITSNEAINFIEDSIDKGQVSGIDISLGLFGLVDHVMFVFAYDIKNFYVFDTQKLNKLEYVKITSENDNRFIMKLPKNIIKKRWTKFGRVWTVISKHIL